MVSTSPVSSPIFAVCIVSITVALHGVTNVAKSLYKPVDVPDASVLNAEFCLWRMYEMCWASPNATLASYELLFPVTREALFQRGIVQRFQPLETQYDVAVVWNAMARCREIHVQLKTTSLDQELATLFGSLPLNSTVDAWCGASLLGQSEHGEPPAVAWRSPADAKRSPFSAHQAAFLNETITRDQRDRHRMRVEGLAALAISLAICFGRTWVVSCWNWLRGKESRGKLQLLVSNPRMLNHKISQSNEDHADPSWIDLKQPAE